MYAKYGSALGGSSNKAFGRFSVSAGSSTGMVNGRKSLIMGYNATVRSDHSASLSFNSVGCDVPVNTENTVRLCADDITYNGQSLLEFAKSFARHRNLAALEGDDFQTEIEKLEEIVENKEAELAAFTTKMSVLLEARDQQIAHNAALIAELSK